MGLDITILIAIGSLLMGFITGLIIKNESEYSNGYLDGYNDALTNNNPNEKVDNTKYNTKY